MRRKTKSNLLFSGSNGSLRANRIRRHGGSLAYSAGRPTAGWAGRGSPAIPSRSPARCGRCSVNFFFFFSMFCAACAALCSGREGRRERGKREKRRGFTWLVQRDVTHRQMSTGGGVSAVSAPRTVRTAPSLCRWNSLFAPRLPWRLFCCESVVRASR